MKNHKKINCCRLCNSEDLNIQFKFGKIPLGNNLLSSYQKAIDADVYPLEVVKCADCNHFQLNHSVSPELLYATNYTYLSSIGSSFVKHIKEYVFWIRSTCKLNKDSFVFEIGSNDGTCLNEFKKIGYKICGVDPAKIPSSIANKKDLFTINDFFDDRVVNQVIDIFGQADLISSQNALAHIDDLSDVFKNAFKLLKNEGYFVFEVGYFKEVLENQLFDTIYHEHLDYHHGAPLVKFLNKIGFSILNMSVNGSQGGSLRVLLKKTNDITISNQVLEFLDEERNSILFKKYELDNWFSYIYKNLEQLKEFVVKTKKEGINVLGYGAPTKATLLIEASNLSINDLDFIVDDNEIKVGRYLPKHGIEIKNVNELKKNKNCCVIILAWNFSNDIILKLKNLKLDLLILVPLPKFKIIKL